MGHAACWIVEEGRFRPCPDPSPELASIVCLHTHSSYSKEEVRG